jgi:hypothetical protein
MNKARPIIHAAVVLAGLVAAVAPSVTAASAGSRTLQASAVTTYAVRASHASGTHVWRSTVRLPDSWCAKEGRTAPCFGSDSLTVTTARVPARATSGSAIPQFAETNSVTNQTCGVVYCATLRGGYYRDDSHIWCKWADGSGFWGTMSTPNWWCDGQGVWQITVGENFVSTYTPWNVGHGQRIYVDAVGDISYSTW